jgi:hypothetical protein
MKPRTLLGIVVAPIVTDRDDASNLEFREVTRVILALVGSATLCACSGTRSLSASSDAAGAGSSQNSSSYVGVNVLVSGLDSGTSVQYSVNGNTGVIDANGDVSVPGSETQLTV